MLTVSPFELSSFWQDALFEALALCVLQALCCLDASSYSVLPATQSIMTTSPAVPPPWKGRATKSLGASPSRQRYERASRNYERASRGSRNSGNPWQIWQWWLKPVDDEPTEEEHAAAVYIEKCFRGFMARYHFAVALHALSGRPSLQRAREYKRQLQPHTLEATQEDLHKVVPLPMSCPIECFEAFGEGVYCYMLWMRLMKRTFFVAFAFALGNMAHNWAGRDQLDCGGNCWLSIHTIGNVGSLNASYGVSELLVLLVLLYSMFASLAIVRSEDVASGYAVNGGRERKARRQERSPDKLTLADHTVMLEGLPAVPPTEEALRDAMGNFGAVHSIHIAFAIRDVLLRMKDRKKLLQDLHAARCELCVLRVKQPQVPSKLLRHRLGATTKDFQKKLTKNQQRQAACRARIREHDDALRQHDEESIEMLRRPRDCTGHAFVTFVEPEAAIGAIEAINARASHGSRSQGAPEASPSARLFALLGGGGDGGGDGGGNGNGGGNREVRVSMTPQHPAIKLRGSGAPPPTPPQKEEKATTKPAAPAVALRASRAPHPTDLQWENLEFSRRERQRRHLVSTAIMLLLASLGSAVIAVVAYATGNNLFASLVYGNLPDGFLGVVCGLLFSLALAIPTILSNVMLFYSVPVLAERYEMHHTHAGKEVSCMLKLCFFEVLNTVVSIAAFFIDPNVWHNSRQWYSLGGAMLVNILIGDASFLQWLLDGGPICQLGTYVSARRARTQIEMNERFAEPAGIVIAFRLSLAGKFVVLCCMFGAAIPLLYLIAALFFWNAAWLDRYILLRKSIPPPRTDARLVSWVATVIFPISIILHVLIALAAYAQIPLEARARAWREEAAELVSPFFGTSSSSTLAGANASAASANATLNATAAFNASSLALLAAPPAAPAPMLPPPMPPDESEEWLAFWITCAVAGIAMLSLSYFYLRECLRRDASFLRGSCCGRLLLRLLPSEELTHSALKTIAGELDDQERKAKLINMMMPLQNVRNQRYLPPLTPKLLEALSHGAAFRRQVSLHGTLPAGAMMSAESPSLMPPPPWRSMSTREMEEATAPSPPSAPPPPPPETPPSAATSAGDCVQLLLSPLSSARLGSSLGSSLTDASKQQTPPPPQPPQPAPTSTGSDPHTAPPSVSSSTPASASPLRASPELERDRAAEAAAAEAAAAEAAVAAKAAEAAQLAKLSRTELQRMAKARGIKANQKTKVIIDQIVARSNHQVL